MARYRKTVSDDLARKVYRAADRGRSQRQIAAETGVNRETVRNIIRRRVGNTLKQHLSTNGRPRCTTSRTDQYLLLATKRDRFRSNRSLGAEFHLSDGTVRNRLKEFRVISALAVRNYLTSTNRLLRRVWCRRHSKTDFRLWLFSDESTFELADCSIMRRAHVHRAKGEKYAAPCILPAGRQNRQKLMVWGLISATGQGVLAFVDGTLNSQAYQNLLRDNLLPFLDLQPLHHRYRLLFQQDNAPCHAAAATRQFLQENEVNTPAWPAHSPDLNPIENVWAMMKRLVRKQRPQSILQLRIAIQNAWRLCVTPDMCRRLFASMPARLYAVHKKHGYL